MEEMLDLPDHKLTILTTLGLDIEGCTNLEEVAKRIFLWAKETPERWNFRAYTNKVLALVKKMGVKVELDECLLDHLEPLNEMEV